MCITIWRGWYFNCEKVPKKGILDGLGQGMTSRLIRMGLPDLPFSPIWGQSGVLLAQGLADPRGHSTTRIPSSGDTGRSPRQTGRHSVWGGVCVWYPCCSATAEVFLSPRSAGGSMLISSFQLSNNCYLCTSIYTCNSLHNMIVCITPLQPRLATCALVKPIHKFCATS